MQVSVETTSKLGRKITVTIPTEEFQAKIEDRITEMAKTAKISGFRPGKVPTKVIKTRYGQAIRSEVAGDMMQKTLSKALEQEQLIPAGMPVVEDVKMEKDQPLEYVASFEVFPTVDLIDFAKLNIEQRQAEITSQDVERTIDIILQQNIDWVEVDRAAKQGDQLTFDFDGEINGEPFPGGKAENANVVLGDNQFIPGFEDQLIGVKAGEKRDINVKFPDDYHAKELAGKEAVFHTTTHTVKEPKKPTLDDDFVKKMGVEDGDLEKFKTQVEKHMQQELKQRLRNEIKSNVFAELVKAMPMEVPKALIDQEVKQMLKQYLRKDVTDEEVEKFGGNLRDQAKERVHVSLILREIVDQNDITPDQEKVQELVKDMAQSYQDPEQMMQLFLGHDAGRRQLEGMALEEQVIDHILNNATLTAVSTSYNDIMNPEPEGEATGDKDS